MSEPSSAQQSRPRPRRQIPWTDVITTVAAIVLAFIVGAILMIVSDTEVRSTYAYFFARPSDASDRQLGQGQQRVRCADPRPLGELAGRSPRPPPRPRR